MKVLALDLDGTTIGAHQNDLPNYLSPEIVDYAKDNAFDCVVFVTKRAAKSFAVDIWQYVVSAHNLALPTTDLVTIKYQQEQIKIDRHYFSSCILGNAAQNFHRQTGIPLLTISTEDDVHLNECGRGYMSIVIHLEAIIMRDLKEKNGATLIAPTFSKIRKTQKGKNTQLQLLVAMIEKLWPEEEVDLTFIDDVQSYCKEARYIFADNSRIKMTSLHFEGHRKLIAIEKTIAERQDLRNQRCHSARFFQKALYQHHTNITYTINLRGMSGNRFESCLEVNNTDVLHKEFNGIESLAAIVAEGKPFSYVMISLKGIVEGETLQEEFDNVRDYVDFLNEFLPREKATLSSALTAQR